MKNDIEKAKELLLTGEYTCVFVNGSEVLTEKKRGVLPLIDFIDCARDFSEFSAADKVVGRGAALLYALMKIKELHAFVISESAAEVLDLHGIKYSYTKIVPQIINRKADGICPMEEATAKITDPEKGYEILRAKCRRS